MSYTLGTLVPAKGCLTRLIDVVNRAPDHLEDLVGFHRGRLKDGFQLLVLKERLLPTDFTFFGYTYMSGGKIGLPSNSPAVEAARIKVEESLQGDVGASGVANLKQDYAASMTLQGPDRLVKIVPVTGHNPAMAPADQYPASRLGVMQLNLDVARTFFVAAEVSGRIWTLANGTHEDTGAHPRYDLPYSSDPRRKVNQYLATA